MLASRIPQWFEPLNQTDDVLDGVARLPNTIWWHRGIGLKITLGRIPQASEIIPGTELPERCLERHILGEGIFCLSLYGQPVPDNDTAERWWDNLAQYIQCQSTASETGIWPPQHALDHGEAGALHAQALELASALNIDDEYAAVHAGIQKGFSDITYRRLKSKPRFRRLLEVEQKRRTVLSQFTKRFVRFGGTCCGTIHSCPLPRKPPKSPPVLQSYQASIKTVLLSSTAIDQALVGANAAERLAA